MTVPTPKTVSDLLTKRLSAGQTRHLSEIGALARDMDMQAYAVGGMVRDLLLERPIADLDIAVSGDAAVLARRAADRTGAGVKVFEKFRTALLVFPDRIKMDLAGLRRPDEITREAPWGIEDDLRLRDFTVNAMAVTLAPDTFGDLLDTTGGMSDLHARRLRRVSPGIFDHDPARIIRAVRFEQSLQFTLERETEAAMREAIGAGALDRMPSHRLRTELWLAWSARAPARLSGTLERLAQTGILTFLNSRFASAMDQAGLERLDQAVTWWERTIAVPIDVGLAGLLALIVWGQCTTVDVDRIAARLDLPPPLSRMVKRAQEALPAAIAALSAPQPPPPAELARALKTLASEALIVALGRTWGQEAAARVRLHEQELRHVQPTVTGETLLAMGLSAGPACGAVLSRLRDARLNGEVLDEAAERRLAQRLVDEALRAHAATWI